MWRKTYKTFFKSKAGIIALGSWSFTGSETHHCLRPGTSCPFYSGKKTTQCFLQSDLYVSGGYLYFEILCIVCGRVCCLDPTMATLILRFLNFGCTEQTVKENCRLSELPQQCSYTNSAPLAVLHSQRSILLIQPMLLTPFISFSLNKKKKIERILPTKLCHLPLVQS